MVPILAVALFALVFASGASAASQRPFKETLGSVEQPNLEQLTGITVDQETGDVLVGDQATNSIRRFHADGTPAPFSALGTNVIDGARAGGKPCSEEPASCDETPQDGISLPTSNLTEYQIAIDESNGPTKGDIYLTQRSPNPGLVDIFAADGSYLGQLTEAGTRPFEARSRVAEPLGVAVDANGAVYVGTSGSFYKFVPGPNEKAVSNGDLVTTFSRPEENSWQLALGSGPTAGSLFVAAQHSVPIPGGSRSAESVIQLDKETGQFISEFAFEEQQREAVTVNRATGNVLTGAGTEYEFPSAGEPIKVSHILATGGIEGDAFGPADQVFLYGTSRSEVSIYGSPAPVPLVSVGPAENVTGTRASLSGTVDPDGGPPVTKCIFEYGKAQDPGPGFPIKITYEHEVACEGSSATEPSTVHATIENLESNGQLYGFRLVAFNENGQEFTEGRTFTTAGTVVTEPASEIGLTRATLNGTVRPEGGAYSECFFQYGLATTPIFEKTVPCTPAAEDIPESFEPIAVKAAITGLRGGSTYRFRLVATNAALGTLDGEEVKFTTLGLPTFGEIRAGGADQSSVALEAAINPEGFGTSYFFEWGPTSAYGNVTPIESIGAGNQPVRVQSTISGLAGGSVYHYRVIATNDRGTVRSADQTAETLNACGLPEGRCFELVSRKEAGPVAIPGENNAHLNIHFQAATSGTGALVYPVESGYLEATKGLEVVYRGVRGAGGWESSQLDPPIIARNEASGVSSESNATQWLSNDTRCGFTISPQPLTPNPSMNLVREVGGSNLYRINPDNSYTPISTLAPENPEATKVFPEYQIAYASQNCDMALFTSPYVYSGIPTKATASSALSLYEWREGTLRNAGLVPGPSGGEEVVVARPGFVGGSSGEDTQNTVSEDGSRIFFSAERKTSPNQAEVGKEAVFVREDGRETRDLSLSETSVPDAGAQYQWATADGSKVFFTANAGLTAETNSEGTDLYEYDLETDTLTDRTVTSAEGGARVSGFIGAAADGSTVYFASVNQLVAGGGNTRAQNESRKQFSIYSEKGGQIAFVATFNQSDENQVLIENQTFWTSQVSPDGRYLLFESSADPTGYDSEGQLEAFLYESEGEAGTTVCLSCRQDGQPPLPRFRGYTPLTRDIQIYNPLHPPRFLTMRGGEPQVFFSSPDPLAPGATVGQNNVYEWSHGQVFRLVSAAAGTQELPLSGFGAIFGGASDDGSDVYLITPETLNWEDGDERASAYDARIGGGFPEPPAAPAPCLPNSERSCVSGPPGAAGPQAPDTHGDSGAQNFTPKKKHGKKHKKLKKHKKHKKKHRKQGKGKKSRKHARRPHDDRRGGK